MKTTLHSILFLALVSVISSAPLASGTPAQDAINAGRTALRNRNLAGADSSFAGAVSAEPNNAEANVLRAITRIAVLQARPEAQKLLDRLGVSKQGRNLFNWQARAGKKFPASAPTADEFKTFATTTVLPEAINAEANLAKVADVNFQTTLGMTETGLPDVVIDYGDVLMVRALLTAFITEVRLSNAFDTSLKLTDISAWLKTNALTLQQIFSKYPKLLTTKNAALVTQAATSFDAGVNLYVSASDFIRTRVDNTDRLFVLDAEMAADEAKLRDELQAVQKSLTMETDFNADTKVNAGAGVTALASVKSPRDFLPKFTFNHANPGTFPSVTFGGVLPGISQARVETAFTEFGDTLDRLFQHSDDRTPPTVTIISPKKNLRIESATNSTVTVTGKAADKVLKSEARSGVNRVLLTVTNDNGTTDEILATGTTDWSATLTSAELAPGVNTIQAISVDHLGNVSKVATRAFFYRKLGRLKVSLSDATMGKVTPTALVGDRQQELGRDYTLTAAPKRNFLFAGWNNDILGFSFAFEPKLKLHLTQDTEITAVFAPNPFLTRTGIYSTVIRDGDGNIIGFASIMLTKTGAFTGKLVLNGTQIPIRGVMDPYGSGFIFIESNGFGTLYLSLTLDISTDGSRVLSGFLSDDFNEIGNFTANAQKPTGLSPSYTVIFRGDSTHPDSPQGTGFASATVTTSTGAIRLAGTLADGTPFTYSATVDANNQLPVFFTLLKGRSTVLGELTFDSSSGDDITGSLSWSKVGASSDPLFKTGFDAAALTAIGSIYTKPKSTEVPLGFRLGDNNAEVNLTGGNLNADVNVTITLGVNGKVKLPASNPDKLQFSLDLKAGLFSGKFLKAGATKLTSFGGALIQTQSAGEGFFLGKDQSGVVEVSEAP